jgi:prophage maintenance system killer protein
VKPIKFVTLSQAKAIHEQQLAWFGGTTGIIDEGKLESALEMLCNWLKENTET